MSRRQVHLIMSEDDAAIVSAALVALAHFYRKKTDEDLHVARVMLLKEHLNDQMQMQNFDHVKHMNDKPRGRQKT